MDYVKLNLNNPEDKQAYIDYIKEQTGTVEILHFPVHAKRTDAQNRRYWAFIQLISQETGHSIGYHHRQMKDLYALVCQANPFARKSTKNMSKSEFNMFMDLVLVHHFNFLGIDSDEEREP